MEPPLPPRHPASVPAARSVLVLASRAADALAGCGGALALHARQGVVPHVVLTEADAAATAALAALGATAETLRPAPGASVAQQLADRIAARQADLVYAPWPGEPRPDARAAAATAIEATARAGARLAWWEQDAALAPNLLVDVSSVAEAKQGALLRALGDTAAAGGGQAATAAALATFRGCTTVPPVRAAEAFRLLAPGEATPWAGDAAGCPLVSILVRSVDRETLADALSSVAVQTYPRIEVVVIAARPGHRPLPAHCGPHPLRLVDATAPRPRSAAANEGLRQARGDFLLLLDDDDWLMPGHVERLARTLVGLPRTGAAYAGVMLADAAGQPLGQVMDIPFDGVRQLAGNLAPIHAVLFRRTLLAQGCRFDETLDRYEDWDFWLQLSRHTQFAHVPGVSAAYRVHASSGVHEDVDAAMHAMHERWSARWRAGESAQLMRRAWATEVANARADAAQANFERLRAAWEQQQRSISWRITAPLRWLGRGARAGMGRLGQPRKDPS